MPQDFDADILNMLGDFGKPATHGAESGQVIVDETDEAILQAQGMGAIGKVVSCLYRTSDFPTLKVGESWVVGGVTYLVADRLRVDDGLLSKMLCRK